MGNLTRVRAVSAGPPLEGATKLGHALERLAVAPIQRAGDDGENEGDPRPPKKPRQSNSVAPAPGYLPVIPPLSLSSSSSTSAPSGRHFSAPPLSSGLDRKRGRAEIGGGGGALGLDSITPPGALSLSAGLSAEEAFAALDVRRRLPGIGSRAVVATSDRRAVLSGHAEATDEQASVLREAGLEPIANYPKTDRAWQIGHVFTDDQPSTKGASWHADPLGVSRAAEIGDSFRECNSCQGYTLREAIASGETKRVRDPNFLRTFEPVGRNAKEEGSRGFGDQGFGRARVTKREVRGRLGKPAVRREEALAFPGGVTVAEQEHRPGQTILRFPNTSRFRVPEDVATSEPPRLYRRPPRASLGSKPAEEAVEGRAFPGGPAGSRSRRVRFETDEGLLFLNTDEERPLSLDLHLNSFSEAAAREVHLARGDHGLVSGAARVKTSFSRELHLSRLAHSGDPGRASASTSSAPSPFALPDPTQPSPFPAPPEGVPSSSFSEHGGLTEEEVLQFFAFGDEQRREGGY